MQRDVTIIAGRTGSGKSSYAKKLVAGMTRAIVLDYRNEYPVNQFFETFDELFDCLTAPGNSLFRVGYNANETTFPLVCDLARLLSSVSLVVEEIDRYFSGYSVDSVPEFAELVARGRHDTVGLVGVSQFPARIPIELRREASKVVAFHHHEPQDLKWFRDCIGRDAADMLPQLGILEGLEYNFPEQKLFKINYVGNRPEVIYE